MNPGDQLDRDLASPRRSFGYISGPISHRSAQDRAKFRLLAETHSVVLWEAKVLHFCPHVAMPPVGASDLAYEDWMELDLELVRRSDWLLMLPGWENSEGAVREFDLASELGIPVAFSVEEAIVLSRERDQQLRQKAA